MVIFHSYVKLPEGTMGYLLTLSPNREVPGLRATPRTAGWATSQRVEKGSVACFGEVDG